MPTGAGAPAPDAASAWAQASEPCRGTRTLSAQVKVGGRAGEQKLRGATLHGAVTAADQLYFELPAPFGQPFFRLAGTGAQATLHLVRDKRVLRARADEIIEALIGLRLAPRQLLSLLAGCADPSPELRDAQSFGAIVRGTVPSGVLYLRRGPGSWQVAAASMGGLLFDFVSYAGPWPSRLRITSEPGHQPTLDISFEISQTEVNGDLPASVFTLSAPEDAAPMTLQQLRDAGPLGDPR